MSEIPALNVAEVVPVSERLHRTQAQLERMAATVLVETTEESKANWRQRSACGEVDPELFYPENGDVYATRMAKKICQMCDVRVECLDDALESGEPFAIRGGLTKRERQRTKRRAA